MYPKAYEIPFQKIGLSAEGYIAVAELEKVIPFQVNRIFWTYYTPESVVRGRHAHYHTEQVLVAVAGRILLHTETPDGLVKTFILESPHIGVYIPPHCWHTMQYSHNAVQLAFASTIYNEADYIRDFEVFKGTQA